jgi:hypothetical protein
MDSNRTEREEEALAKQEARAAAAEPAGIGGDVAEDSEDPAEQPLNEVGEGEADAAIPEDG